MIDEVIRDLKKRTRWFDIIEVTGTSTPISFKNSRIHSIHERQNSGCGVRVNIDGRTGFSYTNDASRIRTTSDRAIESAPMGDRDEFDLPSQASAGFEPYDEAIHNFNIPDHISVAQQSIEEIIGKYPTATVDCGISRSTGTLRIVNSKGIDISYKNSYFSISLSATLIQDDGTKLDIWESRSSLSPEPYDEMPGKIIKKMELASKICAIPSGKVAVILSPKAFARMISIVTSGLNAKSVWKGISPFAGKIGETAFNKKFTLYDDPEIRSSPFSFPFDDEGVTARKKALISNGTISKYITDLKFSSLLGIEPEGNGSRGYSSLPAPSFSNLIIDCGTEQFGDLARSVNRCLLVEQFIGLGQSNTLTGDFSANLDLAFLTEKGEITGRVKDCMITDNLFRLLADDIVLSKERETHGSTTAPYILFPSVNYTGQQ